MRSVISFFALLVVLTLGNPAMADHDFDFTKERLAASNYDLISMKIVKTGDVFSQVKKSPFGDYYREYSRPVLFKIIARCKPTGKLQEALLESEQYRDKWGNWTLGSMPISFAMRLDQAFPKSKCETEQDVRERLRKEAIEREKRQKENMEKEMLAQRFTLVENKDKMSMARTVIDTQKKLIWHQSLVYFERTAKTSPEQARRYCKNFKMGNYQDWRLPTREELEELRNLKVFKGMYSLFHYRLFHSDHWVSAGEGTDPICTKEFEQRFISCDVVCVHDLK